MMAPDLPAWASAARWLRPFAVACIVLVAGSARADQSGDDKARAIQLTKEGGAAYRDGRYSEAQQRFEEAYRAFPAPPLLLNLSRTQLKLGDCDESLRYAQQYLAASPAGDTSTESPDAWLATVNRECPEVSIRSEPAGAILTIEGSRQNAVPTTPWKGRLSAGAHALRARKEGFADAQTTLQVAAGQPLEASITFTPLQQPAVTVAPRELKLTPVPPPQQEVRTTPAVTAKPASPIRKAGWAMTAIGGAALAAAVALGVASGMGFASLHTATPSRSGLLAQQQISTVSTEALSADVLYAAGGVLAAGGVALVIVF